jgi:ATP-dependent DNA ligase
MVLRSGRLPTGGDYAFEPKWDGFRALVSRNRHLRVKSRRGWDMTSLVPELAALPDGLAVDGELVAFGSDGLPSFPRLCDRMLYGKHRIEVMLVVFDVLVIEGRDVIRRPYWERRQLLEDLRGTRGRPLPATQTAKRYGRRSASSASKASWRRSGRATTSPAGAPGSRRRTATTGDTRWNTKLLDRHGRRACPPGIEWGL